MNLGVYVHSAVRKNTEKLFQHLHIAVHTMLTNMVQDSLSTAVLINSSLKGSLKQIG